MTITDRLEARALIAAGARLLAVDYDLKGSVPLRWIFANGDQR